MAGHLLPGKPAEVAVWAAAAAAAVNGVGWGEGEATEVGAARVAAKEARAARAVMVGQRPLALLAGRQ